VFLTQWQELQKLYLSQKQELKINLQNFLNQFPQNYTEKASSWPVLLVNYLNGDCELLKDIRFNALTKPSLNKEKPELYRQAQAFVEMERDAFYLYFNEDFIHNELEFINTLQLFINQAKTTAPKYLDFSALEYEMLNLCRNKEHPFFKQWIYPKLIIVDEFQDTNESQLEIIQSLSSDQSQWYLVGDPKQSIYSFRSAKIEIFKTLTQTISHKLLSTNYRSQKPLLSYLNSLQNSLFQNLELDPPPQILEFGREESFNSEESVRYWTSQSKIKILPKNLLDAFQLRKEQNQNNTHAFLFLRWKKLYKMAQFLERQSQEYIILGKESYLDHHLTDLFCFYLEFNQNPNYALAKESLAQWQFPINEISPNEKSWKELFLTFTEKISPYRWVKGIEWTACMEDLISQLEDEHLNLKIELSDLSQFIRKIQYSHVKASEIYSHQSAYPKNIPLLLTVHASKGLEFDHVYIAELYERAYSAQANGDQDLTPSIKYYDKKNRKYLNSFFSLKTQRHNQRVKEAEMKRVLYVALTRAKISLDIFFEKPTQTIDKNIKDDFATFLQWPPLIKAPWSPILDSLCHHQSVKVYEINSNLQTQSDSQEGSQKTLWYMPQELKSQSEMQAKPYFLVGLLAKR
jgi:ATP-dependent exoDNAse (exonuclease V) beta subunit